MNQPVVRRLFGVAGILLILGLVLGSLRWVNRPTGVTVTAELGRAGSGLRQGTDVKVRGVAVGQVAGVRLEDGRAVADLEIDNEPPLPAPDSIEMVVTAKTFLGEKQIELNFDDERFGRPPFLRAGDTLVADRPPTEVSEVLDALTPFIDAVEPRDLATIIEALAEQEGEGETIARNIELGQQLADFGARTAEDALDRLATFARVADTLGDRTDDFNRLNRALPDAVNVLPDRQLDVRANLEALRRFSTGLAEFLEVEEEAIGRLATVGDIVGAVLERHVGQIGEIVFGLYRYTYSLGHHGGDLDDGTEFGFFRIFLQGEGLQEQLCEDIGPPLIQGCEQQEEQ